ncbi:Uncharacterized protein PBTT_07945 [Plasmodiophora brassicae]
MGHSRLPLLSLPRVLGKSELQHYTYALEMLALARDPEYWKPSYDQLRNMYARYSVPGISYKPGLAELLYMYECMRVARFARVPRLPGQKYYDALFWNEPVIDTLLARFAVTPTPTVPRVLADHQQWLEDQDPDPELAFHLQEKELRAKFALRAQTPAKPKRPAKPSSPSKPATTPADAVVDSDDD